MTTETTKHPSCDWPARRQRAAAFAQDRPVKNKHYADRFYAYDYQEDGMLYLHWFDDNAKKPVLTKIGEACAAYEFRFGTRPDRILVSEADAGTVIPGCEVKAERRIGPHNYQVGKAE
jgi:hypothetical protein